MALPVGIGIDAADEVLAQHRVVQAAFFLDGKVRTAVAERLSVGAASTLERGVAVFLVDLDALQAARGRLLHEHVAADVAEGVSHLLAITTQRRTVVDAFIAGADYLGRIGIAHHADGFTWNAKADGNFRTNRHPIEILAQQAVAQV